MLVEDIDSGEVWGRSYRDAPEVDGMVCVSGEGTDALKPGGMIKSKINDCNENDLLGEAIHV